MSDACPAAVLLFGGSFNPIHHGHLIIARSAAEQLRLSRVVLIPCATPPHKPVNDLASADHRLEMCRRATAGNALFEVDDWETRQTGANYTLLTVQHHRRTQPQAPVYWLIGMDSLLELHTWFKIEALADACTLVTAARPGFEPGSLTHLRGLLSDDQCARILAHVLPTPQIEISASRIRGRIGQGQSIRYETPDAVVDYIQRHNLYR